MSSIQTADFKFDKIKYNLIINLSLILYLILINISNIVTTEESYIFISNIRNWIIVALVILIPLIILIYGVPIYFIFGLLIFILWLAYGFIFAKVNGGSILIDQSNWNYLIFPNLCGVIIFSYSRIYSNLNFVIFSFFIFQILGFILIYYFNGIDFTTFPKFRLTYFNTDTLYSQGLSKFFGIFSIISLVYFLKTTSKFLRLIFILGTIFGIFLFLLGGARGESFFGVLVISLILFIKFRIKFIMFIIPSGIIIYSFFNFPQYLDNFILYSRITQVVEGDYGDRDLLFANAINLIKSDWVLLLFGKGFAYFQNYYNYSFGNYPHNYILEFIITFGILPTFIFLWLCFKDFPQFMEKIKSFDLVTFLLLYLFLVDMKSGTLITSWIINVIAIIRINDIFFQKKPGLNDK
ncbi:MAG: hypothetical protein RIR51_1837 [Bacteroidota bacterium]